MLYAQIGVQKVVLDPTMFQSDDPEEVRQHLRFAYPEVANATIRVKSDDEGNTVIDFLPQAGRKG